MKIQKQKDSAYFEIFIEKADLDKSAEKVGMELRGHRFKKILLPSEIFITFLFSDAFKGLIPYCSTIGIFKAEIIPI